MLWLISYDVSDDNRRRRLYETLKDFGRRVQFSVFECELEEAEMAELRGKMAAEIDGETDSVRCYRLCGGCANLVEIIGQGERYSEPPFLVI